MKKTLSLILAALLLASSMTACGSGEAKETEAPETQAVETVAPAADSPETDAPVPSYDTSLITENGVAKAHIVVLDGADPLEQYAAEELAYHISKVSGAQIPTVNTAAQDSLPMIIATPDSLPELETLFPEDLTWLRDLGVQGSNEVWGDDGFAVRTHEGKIYIFGANAKGALNGVYDFIEENMDVLWVRSNEEIGMIYDEQPTVTVLKTDYREKSPFSIRGWHLCGGTIHSNPETSIMLARNKFNTHSSNTREEYGIVRYGVAHNVKELVYKSPIYNPEETEYWCTNSTGEHVPYESSTQINFFSMKAAEAAAASIVAAYKDTNEKYAFIGMEDAGWSDVFPEQSQAFEYAPGQFVEANSPAYQSTVFFTFVNRVARLVKEELPDLTIGAFAYFFATTPPVCEIEDNVCVTFCTYEENLTTLTEETWGDKSIREFENLKKWTELTSNIMIYSYYGCIRCGSIYPRPIWDRLQTDAQFFAEHGFKGVQAEGIADDAGVYGWLKEYYEDGVTPYTNSNQWDMNALSFWVYGKLLWNPYEDVDALVVKFCDKVYGNASEHMQEFYRLVQMGWKDGADLMSTEFNNVYKFSTPPMTYWDYFINVTVGDVNILEGIQEALQKAWDAANDAEKAHIRYIKEVFDNPEEHFVK